MSVKTLKTRMLGEWTSIAPEVRPSAQKNANGSLKPFICPGLSRINQMMASTSRY